MSPFVIQNHFYSLSVILGPEKRTPPKLFPTGNNILDDACISDYYSRKGIKEDPLKNRAVTAADIGTAVRKKRKEDGLTLADAAALCGVGYRFMSDLENGKETAQVGKVLKVLTALGLNMTIEARKWPE